MKTAFRRCALALLATGALFCPSKGSDHADPMSLDPFQLQEDPVANITDLHAFLVDKNRRPVLTPAEVATADQLVVSLCVRRRLLPGQIEGVTNDLPKYSFRIHLDLNPEVRFHQPNVLRNGADYRAVIAEADQSVQRTAQALETARRDTTMTNGVTAARKAHTDALTHRGQLIAMHQRDASHQALYGGIIDRPQSIAEEAVLEFKLKLVPDGENSEAILADSRIEGISTQANTVTEERRSRDGRRTLVESKPWKPDAVNIQVGVFDDPFIFPRFFRANVIGIVASIPLAHLHRLDGFPVAGQPILLWATTHRPKGQQSDHVGRSLRTQLPRFGFLNSLHPSEHVAAIMRRHAEPNLIENILTTFISPLEAHRHYDSVPDVMVFDLSRPAKFPNGRWLEDDVAKALSNAGETLLVELSYTESAQFPRSEVNDKPFLREFPYLAPRWTNDELMQHSSPGTSFSNGFKTPDAPNAGAIASPNFQLSVWKSLGRGLQFLLLATGALLLIAARGFYRKVLAAFALVVGLLILRPVSANNLSPMDPGFTRQPQERMIRVLAGLGYIGALGLSTVFSFGVRRGLARAAIENARPLGEQGLTEEDRQYTGSTFNEVRDAILADPYYGSTWGEEDRSQLPVYPTNFATVAQGLFSLSRRFLFQDAARRTVESHADLRWGQDRKGVQRLLHPNGVCLTGQWTITEASSYTGFFAKGSNGLIIARYSSGLSVRRGEARTLSLVGKIYGNPNRNLRQRTASLITQEELGASYTAHIADALLRNAPEVTPHRRGWGLGTLFLTVLSFVRVDRKVMIRQLYEIAELGKPTDHPTVCPTYLQLKVVSPRVGGGDDTCDFRDEILAQIYDRGNPVAKRELVFEIQVSDQGTFKGIINKTLVGADWRPIGRIIFKEAVASHNGDFVIHFHHPKWREDLNKPGSEPGPGGFGRLLNRVADRLGVLIDLVRRNKKS